MEVVFHDITPGERLAFQNVVSSRAQFHYSELAERFDAFTADVVALGGEPRGPLFYGLNNVPTDGIVDVEMFLPIRQNTFPGEEGLRFHSYFEVSPLLRGVVTGDFERQTEVVYARLLATLEANDLEMNSPFFHVFQKDVSPYALVYVGYAGRAGSTDPSDTSDIVN
jgi:hypothetical protein